MTISGNQNIGRPACHSSRAGCIHMHAINLLLSLTYNLAIIQIQRTSATVRIFALIKMTLDGLIFPSVYPIGASPFNDKSCSGNANIVCDMSCVRRNFEIITVFCGNVCQERGTSLLGESCHERAKQKANNTRERAQNIDWAVLLSKKSRNVQPSERNDSAPSEN